MPSGRSLLAAVPLALVVGHVWPERHTLVFFASVVAILVFTLRTHRSLYGVSPHQEANATEAVDVRRWVLILIAATVAVAFVSELLVRAVAATSQALGMTELFVGVVVVALVGNAAEHLSAVTMAADNQMDAAIAIAVGSSTQIALFVAPVLLLLSYMIAPHRWTCTSRPSSWWRSGSPCSPCLSSPTTARRTGWKGCSSWRST